MISTKKILISQGDGNLSGIEYKFINVLKNSSNIKWIVVSDKIKKSALCNYLWANKFNYERIFVAKRKFLYFHFFILYIKFLRQTIKEKNSCFYVSGFMIIILFAFLPIKKNRKILIIRNDIRVLKNSHRRLLKFSINRFDKVITNSIFNFRFFHRYFKKDKSLFTFEPSEIPYASFENRFRKIKNNNFRNLTIAVIASMREVKNPKGIAEFINIICQEREDIVFKLIGNNHEFCIKDKLNKKILNKVKFLGVKTKPECIDILLSVNYLLSLSFFEGCPNSVIEAMSMGIPCILSDILPHKFLSMNSVNHLIALKSLRNDTLFLSKKLSISESIGHQSFKLRESINEKIEKHLNLVDAVTKF